MTNVAGVEPERTDLILKEELTVCGIEIVEHPEIVPHPEVRTHLTGKIGENITMYRNWYYWVVQCEIPLEVALEMYADPAGRRDVRVAGYAGNVDEVEPWLRFKKGDAIVDKTSRKPADFDDPCWDGYRDKIIFVDDPINEPGVRAFIDSYHIDSELGLRYFADTIKKHGLA
jgi:hypothetical protein